MLHAGPKITILKAASALGKVGAGIQVTLNILHLLCRWGLGKALEEVSVKPDRIASRRADFHRLLYGLLKVREVEKPGAATDNNNRHVFLRLKSTVTAVHLGKGGLAGIGKQASPPRATGDAVYRAIIPTEVMLKDSGAEAFCECAGGDRVDVTEEAHHGLLCCEYKS
ncbi:hypothetical protein BC835DRAFT_1305780 [Cytidiella melzeri]|nr:hypothetical protein BC835DRAFT_1305780 [Cytidiella melzeri]